MRKNFIDLFKVNVPVAGMMYQYISQYIEKLLFKLQWIHLRKIFCLTIRLICIDEV